MVGMVGAVVVVMVSLCSLFSVYFYSMSRKEWVSKSLLYYSCEDVRLRDRLFRSAAVIGLSPTIGRPLGLGLSLISRLQAGQRHR
jgi:hypothetical protein